MLCSAAARLAAAGPGKGGTLGRISRSEAALGDISLQTLRDPSRIFQDEKKVPLSSRPPNSLSQPQLSRFPACVSSELLSLSTRNAGGFGARAERTQVGGGADFVVHVAVEVACSGCSSLRGSAGSSRFDHTGVTEQQERAPDRRTSLKTMVNHLSTPAAGPTSLAWCTAFLWHGSRAAVAKTSRRSGRVQSRNKCPPTKVRFWILMTHCRKEEKNLYDTIRRED